MNYSKLIYLANYLNKLGFKKESKKIHKIASDLVQTDRGRYQVLSGSPQDPNIRSAPAIIPQLSPSQQFMAATRGQPLAPSRLGATPGKIYTDQGRENLDVMQEQWLQPRPGSLVNIPNTIQNLNPPVIQFESSIRMAPNMIDELHNFAPKLINFLKSSPANISIVGHTDAGGQSDQNYNVGLARANEVKRMLVSLNVPADRLVAESAGETQTLFLASPNDKKNRRVTFTLSAG